MAILGAHNLQLHYSDIEIFSEVTLQIDASSRIGIVGPNGSGKTSLINVLLGQQNFDKGSIFVTEGLNIGYVPQMALTQDTGTLRDHIMQTFADIIALESQIETSAANIQNSTLEQRTKAENQYANLVDQYERLGGYDYHNLADRVVEGIGLKPEILNTRVSDASGGERTRAALAAALLTNPDLLILDEPTNYLDIKGLEWLEDFLNKFQNAFSVISHDRYFLDRVAKEIWDLDAGRLTQYKGNYSKYKDQKFEALKHLHREYEKQQSYIRREQSFISRYHAGQRSKEARGRARRLNKIKQIEVPKDQDTMHILLQPAERSGETVLQTNGLVIGYSERQAQKKLLSVPDNEIQRGTVTAIIGGNGTGKSTLLSTIVGETIPLEGTLNFGHNVKFAYYRQGADDIPGDKSILEALLEIRNIPIGEARSYLARFLFTGNAVYEKVESLSGGEKSKLALARLLIRQPNLLILDEPSTHLDIPSQEAIEVMLEDFDGTILLVSHDRRLISMIADKLWVVDQDKIIIFNGTYKEWSAKNNSATHKATTKRIRSNKGPLGKSTKPKSTAKKYRPGKPSKQDDDIEETVLSLEKQIRVVEEKLEAASNLGDIDQIRSYGHEHQQLSLELDNVLHQWEDRDSPTP